jgi:hypothetical protein
MTRKPEMKRRKGKALLLLLTLALLSTGGLYALAKEKVALPNAERKGPVSNAMPERLGPSTGR